MAASTQPYGTGDGTRPTTDGGVDNIGAGEKLSSTTTANGELASGPAPAERMSAQRKDAASGKKDDSAAFELKPDLEPETNREPKEPSQPIKPPPGGQHEVS